MPRLVKEDQPPPWWVKQQAAAGLDAAVIESRWQRLESESRPGYKGKLEVYASLTWDMMPSLPGWTFKVTLVSRVNTLSEDTAGEDQEEIPPCKPGMVLHPSVTPYRKLELDDPG